MKAQNHPVVSSLAHQKQVGYADAEDLLRMAANRGDAEAKKVIDEIDRVTKEEVEADNALNQEMAAKLGLSMDEVNRLVDLLEADPDLERWLLRRVNLTRAHGRPLAHDEHHDNE